MESNVFMSLLGEVLDSPCVADSLSESLYREILDRAPPSDGDSELEPLALAIRQLGKSCRWGDFRWAQKRLEEGVSADELPMAVQQMNQQRDALLRGPEFQASVQSCVEMFKESEEQRGRHFRAMRDAETLVGYDQEVTDKLVTTLGPWNESAVPKTLLDLIPEEVKFPLSSPEYEGPYDHRLHLLVEAVVSRLGEVGLGQDTVIKQCGHVLAEVLHAADDDAAASLVLRQASLLAEEFVRWHSWDVLGLCWRGQLACLEGDDDVAAEFAERIWKATASASAHSLNQVLWFFALAQRSIDDWGHSSWYRLCHYGWHLSQIRGTWMGTEQRLASAILRRASLKGTWDTTLPCSALLLQDDGFLLKPSDLPAECWVWMAEHLDHTHCGAENYYTCWSGAYGALDGTTDPMVAHNILAVLLAGSLLNKSERSESPSIQLLLGTLHDLHRAGTMPEKKEAALAMAGHVLRELRPDYFTAADRLAITKALEKSARTVESLSLVASSPDEPSGAPEEEIHQILLKQTEVYLKTQVSEATWARLSSRARNEFKQGEFNYILASKVEGEGGNYDTFVIHCSKGLLFEIQESLRGPLFKDPSLKKDFLAEFRDTDHPEWSELLIFLSNLERIAGTTLGKRLMGQGVALQRLRDLREPFEKLKSCRNKAAHTTHRIDREEAAVLHDLLWNKGLVRKVVEVFRKVPKR